MHLCEATARGRGTTLVLGGARSGKSHWAEEQFAAHEIVDYVATSAIPVDDPEWAGRVAVHRERRPDSWRTIETLDLVEVLGRDDATPVLVDCLAVWLARVLDDLRAWDAMDDAWRASLEQRVAGVVEAVRTTSRDVVLVSNEVGSGVVPATSSGRLFRDELGRLNARVAGACDEVWLTVAGIARRWK